MPFTPLHMGPGMAIKLLADRHFSLCAFGLAQVAIDIEPLVRILRGDARLHGPSHSYAGAILLAVLLYPLAVWLCPRLLKLWPPRIGDTPLSWLAAELPIPRHALALGLLLGTCSHVAIDSVMHADLEPWWPLHSGNPWLLVIGIDSLHLACLLSGVIGLIAWASVRRVRWNRRRRSR